MHKRRFVLLFLFLTGALLSGAAFSGGEKKNMLWQVSSEKGSVYLAGSFHLLTEEVYPLPAVFLKHFEASDALVLEVQIDSLKSPAVQQQMLQRGVYQDDRTFKAVVPESLYVATAKVLAEAGVPIVMFQKFKPWFMAMTLSVLHMQKSGFKSEHGLDFYFVGLAKEADKPILGLETAGEQIGIFADLSDSLQTAFLQQTVDEIDALDSKLSDILEAWKQGDAERIAAMLTDSMADFPALQRKLLRDRNERWVEKIAAMLENGTRAYIVVGAGHLAGPYGLPTLLKDRGYRVRQL